MKTCEKVSVVVESTEWPTGASTIEPRPIEGPTTELDRSSKGVDVAEPVSYAV